MKYDVKLEQEADGTYLATTPDLPEVAAVGDDKTEALLEVIDAIETAIQGRITDRQAITYPAAQHRKGHEQVELPIQAAIKAELHNAMLEQKVRKSDLAHRLGVHMPQVDRLLSVRHTTKVEALQEALGKLNKHLELRVV